MAVGASTEVEAAGSVAATAKLNQLSKRELDLARFPSMVPRQILIRPIRTPS